MEFWWMIAGFLLVGGAMMYFGARAAKKRREALNAWASSHGMTYTNARDGSLDERFPNLKRLRSGSNRYGYNFMEGDWQGHHFFGFDYHYETHSTDSKGRRQTHHHHFSAIILGSSVPLKHLLIRPEGMFDKIKDFFGYDDIDFESAEFSKKFHVSAEDKKWAYDVLHARAIEFLLGKPRYTIQFDHDVVYIHQGGTFKPEQFEEAAGIVHGLLSQLPDYVVQQQTN